MAFLRKNTFYHSWRKYSSVYTPQYIALKKFANEPILSYKADSNERKVLETEIENMSNKVTEVPIVIGNEELKSNKVAFQRMPFDHKLNLAKFYLASESQINKAIEVSVKARCQWEDTDWQTRINIFEKAAELISGPYRQKLNAATILGQAKTVVQAELDAACEMTDFIRANIHFLTTLLQYQPDSPKPNICQNFYRFRGCEGFWCAVSPFNFTAIAGNLASAPILMGNSVIWKPSRKSILSNWLIFQIFREAGLPPGVLNFVTCDGDIFSKMVTKSPHLAGLNYTGSIKNFNQFWKQVGDNIDEYRSYPRLIGELGGKNYHFVHKSADLANVINCTIRSAFEYSGQKCSACSKLYVPKSVSQQIIQGVINAANILALCHPIKFNAFTSAVIDREAYDRIKAHIEYANANKQLQILAGGSCDDSLGYYIEPTVILCKNHEDKLMHTEIFGPVLLIYVYEDNHTDETLKMIEENNRYALTGSVFANDAEFLKRCLNVLKMSSGNFYINDKSTGAVVGQQPFGGSRHSGSNQKSGGPHYLLRFSNPQSIKESFVNLADYNYAYMQTQPCK